MRLRRHTRGSRGMVTVELAVTTLAALALLIMMCWGIYLIVVQLRCVDVAAAVARQAARDDRAGMAKARAAAPRGAAVAIERTSDLVTVTVRVTARPLPDWFVGVPLTAQSQVVREPGDHG